MEQIKEQQRFDLTQHESLHQQYDDKLLQELQQLRSQNEQEIVALRDEIASQYEKKVRWKTFALSSKLKIDFRSKIYKRLNDVMSNKSTIIGPI